MTLSAIIILPFLVTLLITYLVINSSSKNGVGVDQPGKRKVHKKPTPRIGGLGIFLGFLAVLPLLTTDEKILSYLIGSLIIFIVGLWDDLKGIGWKVKMTGIFLATTVIIFYGDIKVVDLGNILSLGNIHLGIWALPFTYLSIIGLTNAINLIDGLNGLAGGVSVIASLFLAYFSYLTGNMNFMYINLTMAGAILAFLTYNFPKSKIFLGDSGSLFIGFTIAVSAISVFQGNRSYEPMVPVLILAIPIFDTLRVIMQRLLRWRNPFLADKTHLHHILLRYGIADEKVTLLLWLLSLMFGVASILLRNQDGWLLLLFLLYTYGVIGIFITVLLDVRRGFKPKVVVEQEEGPESIESIENIESADVGL